MLMNCKECGRLFHRVAKDICPACVKKEDEQFLKVSEFLRKNRGASPIEVHEGTEVELETIYRFIREGRLIAENFPSMCYPCERCGVPIQVGRFCLACTEDLKIGFTKAIQQAAPAAEDRPKQPGGTGYHLRDRRGK